MPKFILTVLMILLFSFVSGQRTGSASFYHDKYVGKKTKSGQIFSQQKLTCASNLYAIGSLLRVTNTENGKSVEVYVNDTGAFGAKRIVDLSKKAFQTIGSLNRGLLPIMVEKLN